MTLVFLGLAACNLSRPTGPGLAPLPSPAGPWTITLTQSGGFAGVQRSIEISSDGTIKAQDQRSGRSTTQDLSATQLQKLNELLSATAISTLTPVPPACADCFIYDLEVVSSGQTLKIQVNDVSIRDSGVEALINFLGKLRDDALAPAP
jgi:hypothetical protein